MVMVKAFLNRFVTLFYILTSPIWLPTVLARTTGAVYLDWGDNDASEERKQCKRLDRIEREKAKEESDGW